MSHFEKGQLLPPSIKAYFTMKIFPCGMQEIHNLLVLLPNDDFLRLWACSHYESIKNDIENN